MLQRLRYIFFFLCVFGVGFAEAQLVFEQDIVQGGITAGGFSTGLGSGTGVIDLYVEPGSTVGAAYLMTYSYGEPLPFPIVVNEIEYFFNESEKVSEFDHVNQYITPIAVYIKDIISNISPSETQYEITIPSQDPVNGYFTAFIVIVYKNPSLAACTYSIIINEVDNTGNDTFQISEINPIQTEFPVGVSLYTDRHGLPSVSGSDVFINENHLGLIYGSDSTSINWGGAGVRGHFYFQNNMLIGLDDDNANAFMSAGDGLADISSYLNPSEMSLGLNIRHVAYPNNTAATTNNSIGLLLAYTTPCQPFETTVTDKVENHCGDTVQLHATGGTAYEWLPQQNLSCYDCPNPIYEGDSSTFYTVRIWNTDSCSKVLPVKINIYEPMQSVNLTTTPATCGEYDGALAIGAVIGGQGAYLYRFDENWISNPTSSVFGQLAAGDYTLSVKDQNNCLLHQPFTIGEVNPAEAAFTASPSSGYAPLEVDFINQSNGSTDYEWSLADSIIYSFDFSHTFDSAGSYPVQLVSWYNLPHCADTAATTVVVHPQPPDYNHTLTFPTDYNPQHGPYWVETTNIERMEWQVYNAVGQHIYSTNVETPNGSTALWDGGGHARGYYFFRVRYWDVEGKIYSGRGKVLLMR